MAFQLALGCTTAGRHRSCCCPIITCSGNSVSIDYTITNSAYSELIKICNSTETVTEITPTNGSGTVSVETDCVYFIRATGPDGCVVESNCQSGCVCGDFIGYYVVDVVDGTGAWISGSGTYYAAATGGGSCFFTIRDGSLSRFEYVLLPFIGLRMRLVLFISGGTQSFTWVPVNHCTADTTYSFQFGAGGPTITFKVRVA